LLQKINRLINDLDHDFYLGRFWEKNRNFWFRF